MATSNIGDMRKRNEVKRVYVALIFFIASIVALIYGFLFASIAGKILAYLFFLVFIVFLLCGLAAVQAPHKPRNES